MAASQDQIPDLLLGRRGRGRGPLTDGSVSNPREAAVQATDLDATIMRLSAVNMGYLDDPFAGLFAPEDSPRKLPMLNRGTYVRTKAIDDLVLHFLADVSSTRKQIISLGAGSDTRYFRLIHRDYQDGVNETSNLSTNLIYHEYDLAPNVEKKSSMIRQEMLFFPYSIRRLKGPCVDDDDLGFPNYHIKALDLRDLDKDKNASPLPPALVKIDTTVATLIICEMSLCYLEPGSADKAVCFFTEFLFPSTTSVGFILYEPISPKDPFGRMMTSNMKARGLKLPTIDKYGSLEAQAARMKAYGFTDSVETNMNTYWRDFVSEDEKIRIANLEMMDEMEEWIMLADHYCLVWAWRDGEEASTWNGWRDMRGKVGSGQ